MLNLAVDSLVEVPRYRDVTSERSVRMAQQDSPYIKSKIEFHASRAAGLDKTGAQEMIDKDFWETGRNLIEDVNTLDKIRNVFAADYVLNSLRFLKVKTRERLGTIRGSNIINKRDGAEQTVQMITDVNEYFPKVVTEDRRIVLKSSKNPKLGYGGAYQRGTGSLFLDFPSDRGIQEDEEKIYIHELTHAASDVLHTFNPEGLKENYIKFLKLVAKEPRLAWENPAAKTTFKSTKDSVLKTVRDYAEYAIEGDVGDLRFLPGDIFTVMLDNSKTEKKRKGRTVAMDEVRTDIIAAYIFYDKNAKLPKRMETNPLFAARFYENIEEIGKITKDFLDKLNEIR